MQKSLLILPPAGAPQALLFGQVQVLWPHSGHLPRAGGDDRMEKSNIKLYFFYSLNREYKQGKVKTHFTESLDFIVQKVFMIHEK